MSIFQRSFAVVIAGFAIVATAAPSRAIAGDLCNGTTCTDVNGNTYADYNRNRVQDPGEPTLGPITTTPKDPCDYGGGPGCPGYRNPTYQQPTLTHQQPSAPPSPTAPGYYSWGSRFVGSQNYNPSVFTSHPHQIFVPTDGGKSMYMYQRYGISTVHQYPVRPGYVGFGRLPGYQNVGRGPVIGAAAFTTPWHHH